MTVIAASLKLQNDIKAIMDAFVHLRDEGLDIFNLYWKGSVSSDISALSGSDIVSYSSHITKDQLSSGLTLADQLGNVFFENGSVLEGDYMATCQVVQYGGSGAPTLRTPAIEGCASKMYDYVRACVAQYNRCRNAENFYGAVLYTSISGLATGATVVPDADMTKDEALGAITLIHQFQLFIENATVTDGFYRTTLGLWSRF